VVYQSDFPRIPVSISPIDITISNSMYRLGMGNAGITNADVQDGYYENPSVLAKNKSTAKNISFYASYRPLFTAYKINEMSQMQFSVIKYPQNEKLGGFAFTYRQTNLGLNKYEKDSVEKIISDHFIELSGSWGVNLSTLGLKNQYAGVSVKYITAPEVFAMYNYRKFGLLLDLNYSVDLFNSLHLATTISNVGLPIKGMKFGIVTLTDSSGKSFAYRRMVVENKDYNSTPIQLMSAIAYDKIFTINKLQLAKLVAEFSGSKKIIKHHIQSRDNLLFSAGLDCGIFNTAHLLSGIAYNAGEKENQYTIGTRITLLNHLSFNWFYVMPSSDNVFTRRDFGVSLFLDNMLKWSRKDLRWMFCD
jgi:hypothetical protein